LTTGSCICLGVALFGVGCGIYRFVFGLQASTNLNQQYPWGIWIVADVSFIALAAGGFVTAGMAHILHRHHYHSLVRPALVVALLGYTFSCILLAADLGRYYNIWHPLLPSMWQGNSALFEVGMCVMAYLVVLYLEVVPLVCQRLMTANRPGWFSLLCAAIHRASGRVMLVLVVLGVAISCLHQSSLGHVMVLACGKLHPLWWTPILALLFLISAVVAGLPTVLFASIWGASSLGIRPPMKTLSRAARFVPLLLFIYLSFKLGDMVVRRTFVYLTEPTLQSFSFMVEIVAGIVIPLLAMLSHRVRASARWLAIACLLVMFGVILNRANVYWVGYRPASATALYIPSFLEVGFTVGVAAGLVFLWRGIAIVFPVISADWRRPAVASPRPVRRFPPSPGAGEDDLAEWLAPDSGRPSPNADASRQTQPAMAGG
jgi:Ni/Fe-hydrogenase subunit HybB-like protein